jgi:N-acetyl-gamma-glutamyl-phosphate reductase
MSAKIFIDGAAGTTGLEIRERLAGRSELSVMQLPDAERKDAGARKDALNAADIVILCLPDDAAREAVSMIDNPHVRVIDASTAHRVAKDWAYGFPELEPDSAADIAKAARVANPGCYSTGFLAAIRPLTRAGLTPPNYPYTVGAVSGYSGGGRAMISAFESKTGEGGVPTVVQTYALTLAHKHLPEMKQHGGLDHPPVFSPSVGRFYRGMMVDVPLQLWAMPGRPRIADIHATLAEAYEGRALVEVASRDEAASISTLDAEQLAGANRLKLYVFGNEDSGQARIVALLDNLGKGASGAAVQNLNIMLGLPETTGLI